MSAVDRLLGSVPSLRVLAVIPADAILAATNNARVLTRQAVGSPGDRDYQAAVDRALSPVERTQVGLVWRVARQKVGLVDLDPLSGSGPVSPPGGPAGSGVAQGGGAPGGSGDAKRKVKFNQVLDQADEGEIPTMPHMDVEEYYRRLVEVKGGPVRPEVEPSPDQIAALKVRILDLGLSPYADFGLFVNFQHRFSKSLKFLNHILQPDGTFRAVEVPGPPNFDAWMSSWRVFENALLMFTVEVAGTKRPVVTAAALDEYRDAFSELAARYPESWHLLVTAEDRCRAEHFPRLRRQLEADHLSGLAPSFNPATPWEMVFRRAARERDYWDRHVREPALLFRTSKHKGQPGGTGSALDRVGGEAGKTKKGNRPSQKERLRKQVAKLRDESAPPPPAPVGKRPKGGAKGESRKGGPKRDSQGRFTTDREGRPICFGFNDGTCTGICCKGMLHICQADTGGKRPAAADSEEGGHRTREGQKPRKPRRFLELLAGVTGLSLAVSGLLESSASVLAAQDRRYSADLRDDDQFMDVFRKLREDCPDWVHLALSHHTVAETRGCRENRETKWAGSRSEGVMDEELLANRSAAIAEQQADLGLFFSIENRVDSGVWELKSLARLFKRPGVTRVELEQRSFLTNAPWIRAAAADSCSNSQGATKAAYSPGLCITLAKAWAAWIAEQKVESDCRTGPLFRRAGRFFNVLVREEVDSAGC
ncbi:unnamed protein product [Effrenium voratum]|nr:unnamed protein product [Effrenium voratum]